MLALPKTETHERNSKPNVIKVLCEQTRELTDDLHDFFGLHLMLSGSGNFVVDCHIQSMSSSSVFANNVAKKQSNAGVRRHYN